jgi:hypothetical protein
MKNNYYLFFNTKKSATLVVNYFKKKGCIVKRFRRKERKQFINNKLNLPYIVVVRGEENLTKLVLIENFVVYYGLLFKSNLVNINKIKEVVVKNNKIDLVTKPGVMCLMHYSNVLNTLLILFLTIKKVKEK